jgi:2-(1,2-epoxy-1,2-dihydrophenyl)acetyl-CoA isomerase
MMSDTIKYIVQGSVAKIILNRPSKFNSFNREMALAMQLAIDNASASKEVRAVYISAEGKAFSGGQDLSEAMDPSGPGIRKIVEEHYNPIIKKIRMMDKPVVCGVNGVAAGAGANIALACDVVIAAASSSFLQAFSKIGLVPDSSGTFMLPRLVGWNRASALMMLGDKIPAQEALQMGMIYRVAADDKLQEEAMNIAITLSGMPTKGIALTKKLLNESFSNTLEQQLNRERDLQVEAADSYDYKEGVQAFLEKRQPVFKGE